MSAAELLDEIDHVAIARRARAALNAKDRPKKYERINYFVPSSQQQHNAINCPAKALFFKAGNQSGKSVGMGVWAVYNVLQRFPSDYSGWRQPKLTLERPYSIVCWIVAPTSQMARDGLQSRLLGDVASGQAGTGLVPLDSIVGIQMARGIAGAVDSVTVRRDDGTLGVIRFKTQEQGREVLQAESVDIVIVDEMLTDMAIWNELLARISATSGAIRLCATPLKQQSSVAQWFKEAGHPERVTIRLSRTDAKHITAEQNEAFKASLSTLEYNTRFEGLDFAGGGSVYTVPPDQLAESMEPSMFPPYYRYLIAVDLSHGGRSEASSPFAAVFCAYDPLSRVLRIFDCFKMKAALPEQHVARIMASPIYDMPCCWPHDGHQGTPTGETYSQIYRRLGLRMLPHHAQFEGGGYAVEPGLDLVEQMMATGRLKVARHLALWFEEYGMYERDEAGRVIKLHDHLMDATRIAVMSILHAKQLDPDREGPQLYRGRDPSDPHAFRRQRKERIATGLDFDVFTGE